MTEREYIVSLHRGVDADQFNQDMIAATGADAIPSRSVDIADPRPGSYRNTHYSLTDEEAETLRNDPRVAGVEIPPEQRDDIKLDFRAVQDTNFNKTTSDSGAFVNWGLRRVNDATNLYDGNTAPGGYNYTLDGTGVDVVILDSGIQFGHDEWNDANGVQRLRRINWYTESGIRGTQPGGFYSDYDGHGSHVAGIIAGKTYGWAKNADIYAMKLAGLEGPTDPSSGIPISQCFDLVRGWHNNKTNGRPTVLNLSWGYSSYFFQITGGVYRGTPWTGSARRQDFGMIGSFDGFGFQHPVRLVSIDTDVQECIDAGIHVFIAAGNTFQKIDTPDGPDYDNYYTSAFISGPRYYHRGGSPYDDEAVVVGNVDSELDIDGLEQKAQSSEHGPGVDVYAPGTDIMSASSNTSIYTTGDYSFGNFFYKQMNISGTSMAAPQAAGISALYLQLNPTATPDELKSYILRESKDDLLYDSGADDDFENFRSLNGGDNKFLFNKFNSKNTLEVNFPATATYSISPNTNTISEGQSVTFTLTTTNVDNGTVLPYTIGGITLADLSAGSPTGNFIVNDNTADVSFTLAEDLLTEGNETFTIELDNGNAIGGVFVRDTSTGSDAPRYSLTTDSSTVNEGESFTITLTTENIDDGEEIAYTITGVASGDIDGESLTGSFVINSNSDSKTFTVASDKTTEGSETFVLSLDNGEGTEAVIINDTSTDPTYELSVDVNPVPEGTSVTVTLTTTNVDNGTNVPYTITGVSSADINNEPLTGNFSVTDNTANKVLLITEDLTTEGLEELTLTLDGLGIFVDIDIEDASPNRPAGVNRNITVTNDLGTNYIISGTDATGVISGNNIDINIDYGDTLIFDVNTPGDPFLIKTTPTTGTDNEVAGILNNGTTSGTITWQPRRIGTFYYQSRDNSGVGGQIIVS